MRIHLLVFGVLREVMGNAAGPLELPPGATVADLVERCRALTPERPVPWSSIAVAVNREYAQAAHQLAEGDEVALLPPVSGGADRTKAQRESAGETVELTNEPIDAAAVGEALKRGEDGALVVFDGVVRNNSRGRRTLYLHYEAYPEMALQQMRALAVRAFADFPVRNIAIVHRLGRLEIGETSVAIAVASAHRAAAFDACRWLIDTLKQTVPIWKKEFFVDGAVWAQGDPFPAELTPRTSRATAKARPARAKGAAKKSAGAATTKRGRAR